MNQPVVCTWATVNEGCPISYSVSGSNLAHLMIGDNRLELNFDAESLRELARLSAAALAEMDAQFECEEAERAAEKYAEDGEPAELSA